MAEQAFQAFDQLVDELAAQGRPTVAFGLASPHPAILESLHRARAFADITLVGPPAISSVQGFPCVIDPNAEVALAQILVDGKVDGILRGTLDDFRVWEAYQQRTGEQTALGPALLQDPHGRRFFLSPASNPEGWSREERHAIAKGLAVFAREWRITPTIAVFASERHETYPRKKHIREGVVGILNQTYEDAEWIVERLRAEGFDAKNWAIDLNVAVDAGANILIPVNGMVGNQIFRVLMFCGGTFLGAFRIGPSRPYADNSRTVTNFTFAIKWLAAWINSRK